MVDKNPWHWSFMTFIALLLLATPLATETQPLGKVYRIGYLATVPPPAHLWEALLSGNVPIISGGSGPLLTLWDRTQGNVKGIALPAVQISNQAVTLQMACEKAFGAGQHTQLDHLTVSMSHPDAMAALLAGKSEITAHFASPPFQVPAARGAEENALDDGPRQCT